MGATAPDGTCRARVVVRRTRPSTAPAPFGRIRHGPVGLAALVVTLVASATALSGSRVRYGFDWDLLAVTPYGDQTLPGLDAAFGDDPDVVAATGFSGWSLLLNDRAVPGLAATPIKGELGPTILEGRGLRGDRDLVVGRDTLERLGVEIGDRVRVEAPQFDGSPAPAPSTFRIVGVATFPPVSQIGTDQPRLGTGALVARKALDRLIGSAANDPEWTAVRLADGVRPATVSQRSPDGIPDVTSPSTTWYVDAKPAELRQLDDVRSLLFGAVAISALIALGVVVHALSDATPRTATTSPCSAPSGSPDADRGDAAAWQAVPLGAIVVVVGVPLGLTFGRWLFTWFARNLAVDDRASLPAGVFAALVAGALVAVVLGAVVASVVARRTQLTRYLRAE